jgi:hypothetical protein
LPTPSRPAEVVVDPRRTPLAEQADVHLQIRPGTDGALALGMHHLIFANGWQDQAFLDQWGNGVDAFRRVCAEFPPERVAEICGIEADDLPRRRAVRHQPPAQIMLSPTATVQHSNGFQNHRALILLSAVTGNLDREGGNRFFNDKVMPKPIELFDHCRERPAAPGRRRGVPDLDPLLAGGAEHAAAGLHPRRQAAAHSLLLAMGINTAMWANSKRMEQALGALDFFAASDFFHNPATRMADIVLPAATNLERPALIAYPGCAYQGRSATARRWSRPRARRVRTARYSCSSACASAWANSSGTAIWRPPGPRPPRASRGDPPGGLQTTPNGVTVYAEAIDDWSRTAIWTPIASTGCAASRPSPARWSSTREELRAIGHDGLPVYREPAESPVSTPEWRATIRWCSPAARAPSS